MFKLLLAIPFFILDIIIWILVFTTCLLLWRDVDNSFFQLYGITLNGKRYLFPLAGRFLDYEEE